jgi:hypothetical protein
LDSCSGQGPPGTALQAPQQANGQFGQGADLCLLVQPLASPLPPYYAPDDSKARPGAPAASQAAQALMGSLSRAPHARAPPQPLPAHSEGGGGLLRDRDPARPSTRCTPAPTRHSRSRPRTSTVRVLRSAPRRSCRGEPAGHTRRALACTVGASSGKPERFGRRARGPGVGSRVCGLGGVGWVGWPGAPRVRAPAHGRARCNSSRRAGPKQLARSDGSSGHLPGRHGVAPRAAGRRCQQRARRRAVTGRVPLAPRTVPGGPAARPWA